MATNHFNLLEVDWIPVVRLTGDYERVSLRGALLHAEQFREVRALSPLDTFALYRFLLAGLQWCKPNPSREELHGVRTRSQFPVKWFDGLAEHVDRLKLLHPETPLYQCTGVSQEEQSSVTRLFQELPSGWNVAHMRHTRDKHVPVCLRCVASGLLRLPPFCTQGGQGLRPSINDAPPVYFLPLGRSLLHTLLLNWPMAVGHGRDSPAWTGGYTSGDVGVLEGMTWQPRRVWVPPPAKAGVCSWCGSKDVGTVKESVFMRGDAWDRDRPWRDPHVCYNARGVGLRRPDELAIAYSGSSFWPLMGRALLVSLLDGPEGVSAVRRAASVLGEGQVLNVQSFCFATRQMKFIDGLAQHWTLPASIRHRNAFAQVAIDELDWLDDVRDRICNPEAGDRPWRSPPTRLALVKAVRGDKAKGHAVRAGLSSLSPQVERELHASFNQLLRRLRSAFSMGNDTRPALGNWREGVRCTVRSAALQAVAPCLTGGPLGQAELLGRVNRVLQSGRVP